MIIDGKIAIKTIFPFLLLFSDGTVLPSLPLGYGDLGGMWEKGGGRDFVLLFDHDDLCIPHLSSANCLAEYSLGNINTIQHRAG